MNINKLIPKDKGDIETAEKLNRYAYEELKPIVPQLLTWIQDMNWPVSRPVAKYLESISEHLTDDIINILKGTDEIWKYWCIHVFGLDTDKAIDPRLMKEFKRIATNPTQQEVAEEVQELAVELISEE
ncbi:DUF5071 domain-containing protein [Flagellimonas aquimarina]|uniref:DUF5071 domain-containing protein n=1 Tax=Flagellimonas aquimarina TaxID=2201895 RepID=A0A316L1H1_9FLAO|nr:DUF5071 domain-containing protein [Allomuricauda koreensis]PWL39934.1 DUF5071 domain-containing protein [Allomuricauda koreensis]